ncbi:hypothetical protein [Lysinibacillus endophyticus]|uniref:hypothetical protein n=1 Tax=Ureibacillus endophyticus TaxID=1978490 RepID=UPI00209DF324|nr:hypothetical protein [Lysinibacillus endophyticus]MCP1146159.1 hypothetical protein [Lysinibacillus endophyticus]
MSKSINSDRLKYLKNYFSSEELVKVECPPFISETTKGRVIHRFEGNRLGYYFREGIAMVSRKDLPLFKQYEPTFIIHDTQLKGSEE